MRITYERFYPAAFEKITPGNTATGLDSDTIKPPGTRSLRFTSGGTAPIVVGNLITGATSGATATVMGIVVETGTWAGGNAAGVLYVSDQNGTFQSENLNTENQSNIATIAGDSVNISFSQNRAAQLALVTCEDADAMFAIDGSTPTQSGGTSVGHKLPADQSVVLETPNEIRNFKVIDHTAGGACTIKVTCYF